MILSCDPPRHAVLIHFGRRRQPDGLRILIAEYRGAKVEIVEDPGTDPPTLIAVHFVRHGFRLPFLDPKDWSSVRSLSFESGVRREVLFFHFGQLPRKHQAWQAFPGLTVLISEPSPSQAATGDILARPVLHGLLVQLSALQVTVDKDEFIFEFGADHLKDVRATLFVQRTDPKKSRLSGDRRGSG